MERDAVMVGLVLDEKSWSALDGVGQLAWIHTPQVYDESDGGFYYEDDFPVEIPVGNTINGRVWFTNKYSYRETFMITLEFIDPDGDIVGRWHAPFTADPGETFQRGTDYIVLNKPGVWKLHAVIED